MSCIRLFIREDKNKILPKINVREAFLSKDIIKLQFFIANVDSMKYIEILKNYKSDIENLHSNGILNLKLAEHNMCNRLSILRILKIDYTNLKLIFNYLLA